MNTAKSNNSVLNYYSNDNIDNINYCAKMLNK